MNRSLLAAALTSLCSSTIAFAQPADETYDEPPPVEAAPPPPPPPAEAAPPPPPPPADDPRVAMRRRDVTEVPAAPLPFPAWSTARLTLDLALYAQGRYAVVEGDNLSEMRLDRGEMGARLALGTSGAAELRLETVRSAMDGGALGVDGNSMVVRIRYANVSGKVDVGKVRLEGALGFNQDPWIKAIEYGYTLRPLSRSGSERLLGYLPSDLSALLKATLGPVQLTVTVGNGEGQRYPERNTGKTTTAVAEVVAINRHDLRLALLGMGRDGSVGVASIRDRRAGGGASVITPWIRGGVEAVKAWGIGDIGAAEGVEIGAWADARIVDRVVLGARGATLGYADDGGRSSTWGGGLAYQALDDSRGRLRFWLAVDRITSSGGAMPLPGADSGNATVAMIVASATAPFVLD